MKNDILYPLRRLHGMIYEWEQQKRRDDWTTWNHSWWGYMMFPEISVQ